MIGKNNPMNIRYNAINKWRGLTGSTRGFCDFASPEYSFRVACYLIMHSYRKVGVKDVVGVIYRYAPPAENSTRIYLDYVCKKANLLPNSLVDTTWKVASLVSAMYQFESGERCALFDSLYTPAYVLNVIGMFKLKFYKL